MPEVLNCSNIVVRRGSRHLVDHVDWVVNEGERWVILGPNGAGKTTLMLVCSGRMFPTSGQVQLLGQELGKTDMADLKPLIGWASSAMMNNIPPSERVGDVVLTGAYSVSGRWREQYESTDVIRAASLMYAWGLSHLAQRTFGTLSEGERKRTCIARALMSNPELLLLDEPGAGLDLGGREDLVTRMSQLAHDTDEPTQILITHHVEEIPTGFTHALLMRYGKIVTQGLIDDVITGPWLTATFGLPIRVSRVGQRYLAMRDE